METTLRKMGNSVGLIVPKAMLDSLGLASGARMELTLEHGNVVAKPARSKVRQGWEDEAARIAATQTDEERREREDWLAMPYDSMDDDWVWDGEW